MANESTADQRVQKRGDVKVVTTDQRFQVAERRSGQSAFNVSVRRGGSHAQRGNLRADGGGRGGSLSPPLSRPGTSTRRSCIRRCFRTAASYRCVHGLLGYTRSATRGRHIAEHAGRDNRVRDSVSQETLREKTIAG